MGVFYTVYLKKKGRRNEVADILFMPLGGGQSIGDSCYFLRLGNSSILLDCGAKSVFGNIRGPRFSKLLETGLLEGLQQLNGVYISHAHMDHMGFLPFLVNEIGNTPIYMTRLTQVLTRYQLCDKNLSSLLGYSQASCILMEKLLNSMVPVDFFQRLSFKDYSVQLFQAGHIPGAMMMLFNYKGKNILYTGDYSFESTALTGSCKLPEGMDVDIMLMCGTHAKHPDYTLQENCLQRKVVELFQQVLISRGSVQCSFNQLSKGVEVLKTINLHRQKYGQNIPVYISKSIWRLIKQLEDTGLRILEDKNYLYQNTLLPESCIYISTSGEQRVYDARYVNVDFALHDDFKQMLGFIKLVNPKTAIVVHSPGNKDSGDTIEQYIVRDSDCRTDFIFPNTYDIYQF